MHLFRLLILLSVIIVVPHAVQSITLPIFLDSVAANHPLISQQEFRPRISDIRRQGFLAAEDWRLRLNPRYSHVEPVSTSPFAPTRVDEVSFDASIRRAIWNTGGDLSVNWQTNYTDQVLPSINIPGPAGDQSISTGAPRLYEHIVSVGFTQPLLQNRGGDLDRLQYDLGAFETTIADLQSSEDIEEFLANLAGQFVTWVSLAAQADIIQHRLELAQEERSHLEERYDVNLIDRADLLRAENAYRTVRQQLVLAQSRRDAQAARLAELAQWEALVEKSPEYDLFRTVELPSLDSAYAIIETDGREIQVLRTQRDQIARQLSAYEQTELPRLDLNLSLGLMGGDDTFGESVMIDDPRWTIGLLFRHPLGAHAAETDIQVVRLQQKQLEKSEQNLLLQIRSSVRSILKRMRDLEDVLELNRAAIESARERWQEEQKLYRQGRGQLVWVIQAQDMEQNARLTYAQNAATYHQLLIDLRELTDQIVDGSASR